jgi:hypothetical protein
MFVTLLGEKQIKGSKYACTHAHSVKYLVIASFNVITKGLFFSEWRSADLGCVARKSSHDLRESISTPCSEENNNC